MTKVGLSKIVLGFIMPSRVKDYISFIWAYRGYGKRLPKHGLGQADL